MRAKDHHKAVDAFFRMKKAEDPEAFEAVCQAYPTLSQGQQRLINRKERQVGLLGLAPVRLPPEVALAHGFDVEAADDE